MAKTPYRLPVLGRRPLLGLGVMGLLALRVRGLAAAVVQPGTEKIGADPLAALPALVDTLFPGGAGLPPATAVGVDAAIRDRAARIPEYRTLLEAGCGWLDRQAVRAGAPSFADLAADRRARLVTAAERTPARALPRVLFLNVLADGRDLYFSHPDVWAGLGYGGPPQPEGFPDQDRPPKPRDAAGARP